MGICNNNVIIYNNSEILYESRVISIYDKKGSMKMQDGILDYWYKISEDRDYWINAYYVAIFPILFRYDITYSGLYYVIYEINDNIITYDVFHGYGRESYWESRHDADLFEYLINEEYSQRLRLGELIKNMVEQIDNNIPYRVDITTIKLFYDINEILRLPYSERGKRIYTIIGDAESGGGYSLSYTAVDKNYVYDFDFGKGILSVEKLIQE
jgi:hypothetical protein